MSVSNRVYQDHALYIQYCEPFEGAVLSVDPSSPVVHIRTARSKISKKECVGGVCNNKAGLRPIHHRTAISDYGPLCITTSAPSPPGSSASKKSMTQTERSKKITQKI